LHQSILSKINEMSFFERIWLQNKFIVIISCVLIVLILVVLKILLTPSAPEPAVRAEAVQTTAVANPETTTPESAGAAPAREDGTAGSISVLVKGEDIGAYNVTPNGLIIGRDPTAVDIHIPHDIVSKTHVKIMPRDNQIYLVDLGSTNGTYVNSEKIKESLVKPTDQIQLGRKGEIKIIFKI
ncbi:MAG: FHA domain-containing protein, partial [bacterium]|nr:FHA domain-containing protein [bacterium]